MKSASKEFSTIWVDFRGPLRMKFYIVKTQFRLKIKGMIKNFQIFLKFFIFISDRPFSVFFLSFAPFHLYNKHIYTAYDIVCRWMGGGDL